MSKTVAEIVKAVAEDGMDATFGIIDAAIENGWRDWYCKDQSLKNRSKKFMSILNRLTDGGKVDLNDKVSFSNCYSKQTYDRMVIESNARDKGSIVIKNDPSTYGVRWVAIVYPGDYRDRDADAQTIKFENIYTLTSWLNEPWG